MTDAIGLAAMYEEASAAFKSQQAVGDWFGARLIYAPPRDVDNATFDSYATTMRELAQTFPDFIAGFDLVGQEDKGHPYSDFINQLLQMREDIPGLKFFFHAGETSKNHRYSLVYPADENIFVYFCVRIYTLLYMTCILIYLKTM
jgi:hypothetical protein